MIIYFSGTGNSRYIAPGMAEKLDDKLVDAGVYIKNRKKGKFYSDKPWIFVAPTYCWRLPRIFEKFIRKSVFSGSETAYFVMTCGEEIGNAGEGILSLCRNKGFDYKGVLEVKMPENYIALFNVPDEKTSEEIIGRAEKVVGEGIGWIQNGQAFPKQKTGRVDRWKSGIVNDFYYKFIVKAKPFYATDACISCGKCAESCSLNNISIVNGKPEWGERCTHCMACICGCPVEAVEYGRRTRGKRRYMCRDFAEKNAANAAFSASQRIRQ